MRLKPPLKKMQGYWFLVIPLVFPEYTLNGPKMFCGAVYLNRLHLSSSHFECDVLTL